ncbi:hypothetical protein [Sorangium sp. So ce145]|uniref:hypothetical protein n=1 Tax=Sorangium sp. So ce145 TaxID=3133285 RepID=UPI003F646C3B
MTTTHRCLPLPNHSPKRPCKEGQADLIVLAHALLDDPHWAYHAAKKLGVEQPSRVLPPPYWHWLKR